MIHIPYKLGENTISIPRNTDYSGNFTLRITSELTFKNYDFDVTDEGNSKRYYKFTIDTSDIEDAEYRYFLIQDDRKIADGIIQIGDLTNSIPEFLFYDAFKDRENLQYYPNYKPFIRLTTEEHLTEEASAITYSVLSSTAWTLTAYIRHHTQSEWSQMFQEEHTEKNYQGTIVIGPQVEDYPRHFKIVVATKDGQASAEQEITQDAHYYFSVDVYSPSSAISASATELSYGIQYSEYNSVHTGTFYIWKDDVLVREQPFGVYPYGFSTYMEISANTSSEPVVYKITGILDNGQTDTFEVTQAAAIDYSKKRFTIEMLEDGDILWEGRGYEYYDIIRNGVRDEGNHLDHSIDGLLAGDIVEFYLMVDNTNRIDTPITSIAKHNVYGNIMSLLYVDFEDADVIPNIREFDSLFNSNTNLINAENLILPATTLANYCYVWMFNGCTSLVEAPELPATELANYCYANMFQGCTSLVNAPELSATTLAEGCYSTMFQDCTSLVEAPELPATTLARNCYNFMFARCTSLTKAPELPATTLAEGCYYKMFNGCTNLNYIKCLATDISANVCVNSWTEGVAQLGTFVKPLDMKDWTYGISGIPSTWFVENEFE